MARNTIIAFITLVVILILGFGSYVSTGGGQSAEIAQNQDYRVIENARPRRASDPIRVVEYFGYDCIHCKNFDPIVRDWITEQADDVEFSMQPANFSPIAALLGQSFFHLGTGWGTGAKPQPYLSCNT